MKITEVSYGRTFNIGNYESVRIDLKATVDDNEVPNDVYEDLRKQVFALGKREAKTQATAHYSETP